MLQLVAATAAFASRPSVNCPAAVAQTTQCNANASVYSASSLTALASNLPEEVFRFYSTRYQTPGLDVSLGYGVPCSNATPLEFTTSTGNEYTGSMLQPTQFYATYNDCNATGGRNWGGVQKGWPRGLMAPALMLQHGNMVASEILQRGIFNEGFRAAVDQFYLSVTGIDVNEQGSFITDADWQTWWSLYKVAATTPQPSLPFGANPAAESIVPVTANGDRWENLGGGCEDPVDPAEEGISDSFLEYNVGNAYPYEWEQLDGAAVAARLTALGLDATSLPRYDETATYLVSDFTHWLEYTGKYQSTNFRLGRPAPGTGEELVLRDMPMLIMKHVPKPSRAQGSAAFQIVGIAMRVYDDASTVLYDPLIPCASTWALAKMQFHAVYHSFMSAIHFYETHYWPHTGMAIGMQRHMNKAHPISKLLYKNAWRNVGLAWNGITQVFNLGGAFHELLAISGEDVTQHIYPRMATMAKHHLALSQESFASISDDVKADLKVYTYSQRYEAAFGDYARAFVDATYPDDAAVLDDGELQAMADELTSEDFANYNSFGFLPRSTFSSKQSLVRFITWVLTMHGFKHHLMNHLMMRDMTWCPPHRLGSVHKRFVGLNGSATGVVPLFEGLPPPQRSEQCLPLDQLSRMNTYTCLQEAAAAAAAAANSTFGPSSEEAIAAAAAAAEAATATAAYTRRIYFTAEAFQPNFNEVPDVLASGYAVYSHNAASQAASNAFINAMFNIESDMYRAESKLKLGTGKFKWTYKWATATHPVI